jgi:hypothetical protein
MDTASLGPATLTIVAVVIAIVVFLLGLLLGAQFVLKSRKSLEALQAGSAGTQLSVQPSQQQQQQETTRANLAIGVLIAIGSTIALLFLIMVLPIPGATGRVDPAVFSQTVFPALIGVFGTVCGFYFGGKQATESTIQASQIASGATRGPQLSMPASATPGSTITVSGTNFGPSSPITLTLTDAVGTTMQVGIGTTSDVNGNWSANVRLRDDMPTGQATFFATDSAGNRTAGVVAVMPAPPKSGTSPASGAAGSTNGAVAGSTVAMLMVLPGSGKAGDEPILSGSGFTPDSDIVVKFVDSSKRETAPIGSGTTASHTGSWMAAAPVPADAPAGASIISASDATGRSAAIAFDVQAH